MQTIGKIPEFTSDESVAKVEKPETATETTPIIKETKEVKEAPVEQVEATAPPAEVKEESELQKSVVGLQNERIKLLKEISELKGQKRAIKEKELYQVQEQIDELKDLHPEDVQVIERVLKAKGYISRPEADQMFFDAVKDEELNKFLEKYPEYKPENDPNDVNWNSLQREFSLYARPRDPRLIGELLVRAHRNISKVPTDSALSSKRQQVEIASVGKGGIQQSPSSSFRFDQETREMYRRGGWTEEEIQKIEKRL